MLKGRKIKYRRCIYVLQINTIATIWQASTLNFSSLCQRYKPSTMKVKHANQYPSRRIMAEPPLFTVSTHDTTATHIQGDRDYPNGHGPADEEVKGREAPAPHRPAYEKLAQPNPKPTELLSTTLGPPMFILFDTVVPCIIYYMWCDIRQPRRGDHYRTYTARGATCPIQKPEFDDHILGYAVASLGFGELYIVIARVAHLLLRYRNGALLCCHARNGNLMQLLGSTALL